MLYDYYLGVDFGTSGARAIAIDRQQNIVSSHQLSFANIAPRHLVSTWRDTLFELIIQIPLEIRSNLQAIAINGTSSTVLLCDAAGIPITEPLLNNDAQGQ